MSGNEAEQPTAKDDRLDAIIQVLRLMIETQNTHSEMLARLIEFRSARPPIRTRARSAR
jgi:hypothetical protein